MFIYKIKSRRTERVRRKLYGCKAIPDPAFVVVIDEVVFANHDIVVFPDIIVLDKVVLLLPIIAVPEVEPVACCASVRKINTNKITAKKAMRHWRDIIVFSKQDIKLLITIKIKYSCIYREIFLNDALFFYLLFSYT